MSTSPAPVLVTGATGRQGGATVRALLGMGLPVRALVRDPNTERAGSVAALGARLVTGDLTDIASLRRAADGARGVFSVQMPDMSELEGDSERVQGHNLVDAARAAGVRHFVHSSVSGAGQHRAAPGWSEGRWKVMEHYLETKTSIQDHVRTAGFDHWTLLKPGFFMENFQPPSLLMPRGPRGGLITVLAPDTELSLIAVDDIGAAAAASFADPRRFHRVELELAGDRLSVARIVEILSRAFGVELAVPNMTAEEALAEGMPEFGLRYEWQNEIGHPARPEFARALGLSPTTFTTWAASHLAPVASAT